ncbi:MAG TPA: OmpH family outer membrane protein [Chitinophagaceae bacterium]|nr:OmpH family outer membrane protein [Chitinophagaceae bacterium]
MKNGLIAFNVILGIAVAYLLVMQFTSKGSRASNEKKESKDSADVHQPFRIAYFEMDSVEANFNVVKDVKSDLSRKEEKINTELSDMDASYRKKVNDYQQKAQSMSQMQSETATQDLMRTQDIMKNRKSELDQEYNDYVMRRMKEVKTKIEEFLKDYNKTKKYSYIVSYEQGLFYFRDTVYNITKEVIHGLNEMYKKK